MRLTGFARRDLFRNPRRTLASLVGVVVGVGLFSAVLFFIDGSGASMTRRAVAPLALDMQRVLTAPLGGGLHFERAVAGGDVTLTVRNSGVAAAHEVVVRDRLGDPKSYRGGSTKLDGKPLADVAGTPPFAQGAAATGYNLGTIEPGRAKVVTYRLGSGDGAGGQATVSSREVPTPSEANEPPATSLGPLAEQIRQVPGVTAANALAFVSLPGTASANGKIVDGPVKLFSFDAAYQANYPSIKVLSGGIRPGGMAISAELARDLKVGEGGTVSLDLPGTDEKLTLPVTGITDLSGARPLFESREWRRFEKFVYAKYAVVVDSAAYTDKVVPAFTKAVAQIAKAEPDEAAAKKDGKTGDKGADKGAAKKPDPDEATVPAADEAPEDAAATADETAADKADEKAADEKAADEKAADEKAADEKAADEKAADEKPDPSTTISSIPFEEVDILVDRTILDQDPATALAQSTAISDAVRAVAPGQDYLIDNLGNTLSVAAGDAKIAKRMFVFLGLPGAIVAATLTAYAGALLAGAQRRESALLRVRGASRRHLMFLLALRTAALAGAGSLLGTALGFAAVLALLGPDILFEASDPALLASAGVGIGGGMVVTAVALYVPGRRLVRREISASLGSAPRAVRTWRRVVLELLALVGAAVAQVAALKAGAFDGPAGSVYSGRSVTLPLHLLVAPIVAWLAGTFLIAHLLQAATARSAKHRRERRFDSLVRGVLWRSISRRLSALSGGVVTVALVVALGTMLACFATSYDNAEADDARFGVGSDIRLTPNPTSEAAHPASLAAQLTGPGTAGATPVVFSPENSTLNVTYGDEVTAMAAIDPVGYPRVAALTDAVFVNSTAAEAMRLLQDHPDGVLVNEALAKSLGANVGDDAQIVFGRGEEDQVRKPSKILGLFTSFPGEPRTTGMVGNLTYHQQVTGKTDADYYLVAASDRTPAGLDRAVASLRTSPSLPEFDRRFDVSTSGHTLDKDKSSLTALNVRGLVHLDSFFTFLMAATATAMFVFGLLMQRRREYVTMRAQGLHAREVRRLVLAESGISSALGAAIGIAVGIGMAKEFVRVLRPIFTLAPTPTVPVADLGILSGLVLAATGVAAAGAAVLINRLKPTELLREE